MLHCVAVHCDFSNVLPASNEDLLYLIWSCRQGVGKYLPSDIDAALCTHIVYGFAVLNGDQLIIKPHDSWADLDNSMYLEQSVIIHNERVEAYVVMVTDDVIVSQHGCEQK
jgi:Chitinase